MSDRDSLHRGSISHRLMVWGLSLLAAALIINTVAGFFYTCKQIYRASSEVQKEVASLTARRIYYLITQKLERLQDAGVAMTLYRLASEEQKRLGLLLLKNDPSFGELALLDRQGNELLKFSERHVYLSLDLETQNTSPAFLTAIEGTNYIGPVYTSDRAEPYITLAVPLKSSPTTVIGVLMAQANLKFLWEVISESKFGHGGYAYVVNGKGDVIAHQDASQVLKRLNLQDLPKVNRFLKSRAEDWAPGEEGPGITGKQVFSTYAPVADLGWAGKDLSFQVGGNTTQQSGQNVNLIAGKQSQITAADEITLKAGQASIVLKKNGQISIKGSNIRAEASGDLVLKGARIQEN